MKERNDKERGFDLHSEHNTNETNICYLEKNFIVGFNCHINNFHQPGNDTRERV